MYKEYNMRRKLHHLRTKIHTKNLIDKLRLRERIHR